MIKENIPLKSAFRPKRNKSEWMCDETRLWIKKRSEMWTEYRNKRTERRYLDYNRVRNKVNIVIKNDKDKHRKAILKSFKGTQKKFYGYMRSKQTVKSSVCQLKLSNGDLTQTDKETASELNRYFASVFIKYIDWKGLMPDDLEKKETKVDLEMDEISFDEDIVRQKLQQLHENKAPGPDGLHPMVLKQCADSLAKPLSLIFELSYHTGCVPEDWKTATVTPSTKKEVYTKLVTIDLYI